MNLYRLTVIALRLTGIDLAINGIYSFTSLPQSAITLLGATNAYHRLWDELEIGEFVFYIVLKISFGVFFISRTRVCARFLARKITDMNVRMIPAENVWPPAPRRFLLPDASSTPFGLQNRLSPFQTAVILLKIDGLTWLLAAIVVICNISLSAFGLMNNPAGYWHMYYLIAVCRTSINFLGDLGVGSYFLLSPTSLANRITQDIADDAESEEHETEKAIVTKDDERATQAR